MKTDFYIFLNYSCRGEQRVRVAKTSHIHKLYYSVKVLWLQHKPLWANLSKAGEFIARKWGYFMKAKAKNGSRPQEKDS